jgi:5'-phosphate synthase pdxT subunit
LNQELIIGVLGLQGAFSQHLEVLADLGAQTRRVRLPKDLVGLDGIVLPGGESTTMSNLLVSSGLLEPLAAALKGGLPAFGTCAGLILLASKILDGRPDQVRLNVLDATVRRNGYGRQLDSFECDVVVADLVHPFHAVFIRAPIIEDVGQSVRVLARLDSHPVLVQQGHIMASSFHPELSKDGRIHQMFMDLVREQRSSRESLQSI